MADESEATDRERERYQSYPIVDEDGERDGLEWVGVWGGAGYGTPRLYDPSDEVVYAGEIDEEAQAVRVDESRTERVEEDETLGDHLERVGDEHDWTWLSEFAHDHLETTHDDAAMDVVDWTFDRRNVAEEDDADLAYFGSFTYRDGDGHVHTLEREFDVYTDPDRRTETDQPVAVVEETFLSAEPPQEDTRAGDAELQGQTSREFVVDVEPDAGDAAVQAYCEEWHESHPDPL